MTDYSKPQGYDPTDWQQVQERRLTISDRNGTRQIPYNAPGDRQPVRAYPLPVPMDAPEIMPAATTQAIVRGDYRDRAAAFNRKTLALATTVAAGSAIVGIVGFSVPILSLGVLAWTMGGFLATWLAAYVVDAIVSPEGTALFSSWRAWRWLDREQAHRHYVEERSRWPEDWRS